MARGEHPPSCARRWRQEAETRGWTLWQTAQAIHGCCGVSLLKAHRLARGWSARQAIEELESMCQRQGLGLPRANIDLLNAWENNRARPRPQTIDLLARLYKANAIRLGLAADYCEDDDAGLRIVPPGPGQEQGSWSSEDLERRALFHQTLLDGVPDGRFFAAVESTRQELDCTLATGTVSEDRLDRLDEQVLRYRREYMSTPPMPMLCRVMLELSEINRLNADRQPFSAQRRLLTATTMLALLAADALMKLGDTHQAHAWYGTARAAADDVGDLRLRALVRAQQTMLLYYYGDPGETVRLAREARSLAGPAPSSPAALAAAAEARALARLGETEAAKAALADAERIFARMRGANQDDLAFVFTEKRMKFYRTGTLIELGETDAINGIDGQSSPGFQTIDPALIMLDQAAHVARQGNREEACRMAADALRLVPAEHRTSIVVSRAKGLLDGTDPDHPAVQELRRMLAESASPFVMAAAPGAGR